MCHSHPNIWQVNQQEQKVLALLIPTTFFMVLICSCPHQQMIKHLLYIVILSPFHHRVLTTWINCVFKSFPFFWVSINIQILTWNSLKTYSMCMDSKHIKSFLVKMFVIMVIQGRFLMHCTLFYVHSINTKDWYTWPYPLQNEAQREMLKVTSMMDGCFILC